MDNLCVHRLAYTRREIAGKEMGQVIQLIIEYDPQPPFNSGSISKADRSIIEMAKQAAQTAFQ